MPAKVKVRILAGRNLPVMDKSSDASDAFVEVKLGNTTYKTEVYRRSLNPFWNSEWFRFEVSDQELQDEPLQIRIMDYDTYSANDAIGKVYINLNPLLLNPGRSMNGWLPIYDTLHGIRGEINCMVKVNLFADNNRFRHSSCGVRFFFSDIPNGYRCDAILGFVDELLVNDDPEYQWIDKIRTPRASNEARQTLFTKLSGEVQRKLGLKAEIFGGNAVIGYQQSFDLEGGSGIVGRGIGTAVILSRVGHLDGYGETAAGGHNQNNPYYIPDGLRADRYSSAPGAHHPYLSLAQKSSSTGTHIERPLVHSVSADYFYEVPSRALEKQQASEASNSKTLCEQSGGGGGGGDANSDLETFVSLESLTNDDDDDDDTDVENDFLDSLAEQTPADRRPAARGGASSLFRRSNLMNKSLSLMNSSEFEAACKSRGPAAPDRSTRRLVFTTNFYPKPPAADGRKQQPFKLFKLPKPPGPIVSASKLIQILSNRKTASSSAQHGDRLITQSAGGSGGKSQQGGEQREHKQQAKRPSAQQDHSASLDSAMGSSGAPSASGSSSLKRRKDKSQTAGGSLDDALSVIEEKLDDDVAAAAASEHLALGGAQSAAGRRSRLASTSSGRARPQMTRAKELDLGDPSSELREFGAALQATTAANATGEMAASPTRRERDLDGEFRNEMDMSETNSTVQAGSLGSESLLSSSSSSMQSDETIKAASLNAASQPAVASNETAESSSRKAITQANQDARPHQQQQQQSQNSTASSQTSKRAQQASGANFAQSVGVIKAQQHLLQNMIKHQNQNLVVNSMNRAARSALVYPGRIQQSEYPFVTLKRYPAGLIQSTGGVVSVHSVKLLDHIINDEESETRDNWWTEIRKEIRSHAKSLNCNTILGYTETSKVLGDVCILSARGTAAILKPLEQVAAAAAASAASSGGAHARDRSNSLSYLHQSALKVPRMSSSPPPPTHSSMPPFAASRAQTGAGGGGLLADSKQQVEEERSFSSAGERARASKDAQRADTAPISGYIDCTLCHTPLHCVESLGSLVNCAICGAFKVPDVLLLTIEPPHNLNIVSACSLVQARVCRAKRDSHGEPSAKEIGDALPFLEYELHRQLFSKLKFRGMNCLFNLEIDISVGENFLTGIATGTGCFVLGLPTPEAPQIAAGKGIKANKLAEIQRLISLSAAKNRDSLGVDNITQQLAEYHRQIGLVAPMDGLAAAAAAAATAANKSSPVDDLFATENDRRFRLQDRGKQAATGAMLSAGGSADGVQAIGPSAGRCSPLVPGEPAASNEPLARKGTISGSSLASQPASSSSPSARQKHQHPQHQHGDLAGHQQQQHHHRRHHHHSNHHHHHHHSHHHHSHHHHHKHKRQQQAPTEHLVNMLGDENNIVLEVDDNEDADIIALLIDNDVPTGYMICNSELVPSLSQEAIASINMFTQVVRVKLSGLDQFAQQFESILQTLYVKLRRSLPCCLTNLNFVVDLPESHIVQITVTGCLLGLHAPAEPNQQAGQLEAASLDCELVAGASNLEGQSAPAAATTQAGLSTSAAGKKTSKKSKKQPKVASSTSMSPTSLSAATSTASASSPTSSGASSSAATSASSTTSEATSESSSGKAKSSSSSSKSQKTSSSSSSSSDSSSAQSLKSALAGGIVAATAAPNAAAAASEASSKSTLIKQNSKSNLAALISAGRSTLSGGGGGGADKRLAKLAKAEQRANMEMVERSSSLQSPAGADKTAELTLVAENAPTTSATIAALKQEIDSNRLGRTPEVVAATSGRKFRAVFKKQQTYPGATSPAIAGQDNVLNDPRLSEMASPNLGATTTTTAGAAAAPTTAARKATAILNKVKQPFRDLSSNFNAAAATSQTAANSGAGGGGSSNQPTAVTSRNSLVEDAQATPTNAKSKGAGAKPRGSGGAGSSAVLTTSNSMGPLQASSTGAACGGDDDATSSAQVTSNQAPLNQLHMKYASMGTAIGAASHAQHHHRNSHHNHHHHHHHNRHQRQQQQYPSRGGGGGGGSSALNSSIDITSLSYIPGAKDYHYLGNLSLSFVRETNSVRENGGLNGFIHCFLMEVYAIVRAHVSALGGNAFLSFRLQQSCIFYHSNKNQAQCLISVAGDAVQVSL